MFKKFILFLSAAVVMSAATVSAAEPKEAVLIRDAFSVKVDGDYIQNTAYYDYETGVVYLPLRAVFETLGTNVSWNNDSRVVSITSGTEKSTEYLSEYKPVSFNYFSATVYPDSVILNFDGKPVSADTFIFEDRTYISEETTELLTGHVFADTVTKIVRVYSKDFKTLDENSAAVYGENKTLNYTQFFDLTKFLYGDFETAETNGFSELDNYLIFKEAVKKVAGDTGITVSDKEAEKFAEDNNIQKITEETGIADKEFLNNEVVKDYVLREKIISSDKKDLYNPSDDELESWYDSLAESKGIWLQAQHILISKDENGEGLKKAEMLLEEAKKSNSDFPALMLENSEDPGSTQMPEGYIFTEGQMVDAFYNAALNLKVGEISEIVESEYGYHIIKKINHWENGIPFEFLKDRVKESYNDKLLGEKLYEYAAKEDVFYIKDNIINKYNEMSIKE